MRRCGWAMFVLFVGAAVSCGGAPKRADSVHKASDNPTGSGIGTGDTGGKNDGKAAAEEKGDARLAMSAAGLDSFNKGVAAGARGDLQGAEQDFRKAAQLDPHAPQPYYNLGVVQERHGKDGSAAQFYASALAKKADYLPALTAAAKLSIRTGKKEAAVQLLQTASERFPTDVAIMVLYADVLCAVQKFDDSIRVAKRALRVDERNAPAMLQIGKANLKMGRFELAESIFNQVIAINEKIPEVYFLQGLLELQKGFRVLAIKRFEKALELNPFYPEVLNNLAIEYMLAGNYDSAIQLLERALSVSPSWAVLYLNYGNALRGAGQWQKSLKVLQAAQARMPNLPDITFNMGILFYTADELAGLNRLARLKKSKDLFVKYRSQKGVTEANDADAKKYINELDLLIEREEVQLQRQKEAAQREKERSAQRSQSTDTSKQEGSAAPVGEVDDDEGWE